MAMTLRLTDAETEALRRRAEAEHRSMQQVALAAISEYINRPIPRTERRQAVSVAELMKAFADLPPMDAEAFRSDREKDIDDEARFDAYDRAPGQ